MLHSTFFLTLFFTLLGVATLYFLDFFFLFFSKIWWLDTVTHFGGGFWAGGVVLWGYGYVRKSSPEKISWRLLVLLSVLSACAIGMLWEIYEVLIYPMLSSTEGYFFDTTTDLIADTAGALIAGMFFLYTLRETNDI